MSLKSFVNNKESWDEFCDYLDFEIKKIQFNLEKAESQTSVYRLQGQILALRNMKYMREYLNG